MLKYSAWSIIFVTLTQTINGALQGMGNLHVPVISFGVGAIIKLILNLILIPRFQVNGAILATIISHFIISIICFISLKKNMKILSNMHVASKKNVILENSGNTDTARLKA